MTDIMERLEAFASVWPTAYDSDRQNIALLREAAAEIGRLREKVGELAIARSKDIAEIVRLRGEVSALLEDPDEAELAYRCGDPDSDAIAPAEAKDPAPAMPNGVEGLLSQARAVLERFRAQDDDAATVINRIDALRAADNRDAAGVGRQPDGYMAQWAADQLRSNKYVSCHLYNHQNKVIHGDGKEAVPFYFWPPAPAAVPAGEAVATEKNVHTEHCCREHGCKYGEAACPVELGQQAQSHPCEDCTPQPADGEAVEFVAVPDDYRNQASGYRAGWTDAMNAAPVQAAPQEGEVHKGADRCKHCGAFPGEPHYMAAHPSACELGAVVERHVADLRRTAKIVRRAVRFDKLADEITEAADELEAALQHRGDSRGGES